MFQGAHLVQVVLHFIERGLAVVDELGSFATSARTADDLWLYTELARLLDHHFFKLDIYCQKTLHRLVDDVHV